MTIPLDRLYHFIENIVKDTIEVPIVIYRFTPHGSKKICDLHPLNHLPMSEHYPALKMLCFDQEPTDFDFYIDDYPHQMFKSMGLNSLLDAKKWGFYDRHIFLHSEKRFNHSDKHSIPVYYWSHGLIAKDWFRYAIHENFKKNADKLFLIYSRSWSGSREYRVKFADLLIKNNLVNYCKTTFNPSDPESNTHYSAYQYKHQHWKPEYCLENFFEPTQATSGSSADFVTNDYNSTEIEVVLETLFDYKQLHLTEKSLRPIACCQPFILAATHRSLEYLRSYGFKTFNDVWSEDYDTIENPSQRLEAIVSLMKEISAWDKTTRKHKLEKAHEIALYNQQWFFNNDFFNLIVNELKENLKIGLTELKNYSNNFNREERLIYLKEQIFNFENKTDHEITFLKERMDDLINMYSRLEKHEN